jgi:hypothetical protein
MNRAVILKTLLVELVEDRTNGSMVLSLEKIDYQPFARKFKIFNLSLIVPQKDSVSKKPTSLRSLSFDSVVVSGFGISEILFHRRIKADEILTAKPEIVFAKSEHQIKKYTKIQDHFLALQEKHIEFSVFPIELGVLKVEYGKLIFESDSSNNFLSSAEFFVELHDFNTTLDSLEFDSHSFLFSKRLIIDVVNFKKNFRNNQSLLIDSLKFDSKIDKLHVSNIKFKGFNRNNIIDSVFLKSLNVSGLSISEMNLKRDIKLDAIKFDEGSLNFKYLKNRKTTSTRGNHRERFSELFQIIDSVEVDTITFSNIEMVVNSMYDEKLASVNNLKLEILGVSIDSSNINKDILPDFSNLSLSTGKFSIDTLMQISGEQIVYSSQTSQLVINEFLVSDSVQKINLKSAMLLLDGLDLKKSLEKKPINIALKLVHSDLNLNLSSKYFQKKFPKPSKNHKLFELNRVEIDNANVKIFKADAFQTEFTNLNLSCNINQNSTLSYNIISKLNWTSDNLKFSNESQKLSFSSTFSSYSNDQLILKKGSLQYFNAEHNETNLFFEKLGVENIKIIKSVICKELEVSKINLSNPHLNLNWSISNNSKSDFVFDSLNYILPIHINIHELEFSDGLFNMNSQYLHLNTDLDLLVNNIELPKKLGTHELEALEISINLNNTNFKNNNIELNSDNFVFSTADSNMNISNLSISLDSLPMGMSVFSSNTLKIKDIILTDFDYFKLLKSKKLDFDELSFSNAKVDVYSFNNEYYRIDSTNLKENGFNFNDLDFRKINLQNLKFNYLISDNRSEKLIGVNNFNLCWMPVADSGSLLNELWLDVRGVEFIDDENNISFKLEKLFTENLNNDIVLSKIDFEKTQTENSNAMFLRIPELNLKNINHSSIQSYEVGIEEFNCDSLFLELNNRKESSKPFNFTGRVEVLEKYSDFVNKFNIERSKIQNIDLCINTISDSVSREFSIKEIDVFSNDVGFTSNDSSVFNMSRLMVDIKGKNFISADSLYEFSSGDIYYDFVNNSFEVDSFYVKPRFSRDEFFKKSVFQTDIIDISGRSIVFRGLDLQKAFSKKEFVVSNVDVDGIVLAAHRSKEYPFKHGVYKPLPAELISRIKHKFYVDTLKIKNSYILFGEYVKGSSKPGEVFFSDVNLVSTEFSNMPVLMSNPPIISVELQTKLMGNALLKSSLKFPINRNSFSFSANTGKMNLTDFNSMTENLFGVSIKKGTGYFDIKTVNLGDSISTGSLIFHYRKLRVGLYDRQKAQLNKGIAAPFFGFLVNDLLMKSNNPPFLGKTRTGLVYFERNTEKSFLNYIWKSLLSGILSTGWHNSKQQRKEKRRIRKLQ